MLYVVDTRSPRATLVEIVTLLPLLFRCCQPCRLRRSATMLPLRRHIRRRPVYAADITLLP